MHESSNNICTVRVQYVDTTGIAPKDITGGRVAVSLGFSFSSPGCVAFPRDKTTPTSYSYTYLTTMTTAAVVANSSFVLPCWCHSYGTYRI